MPAQEATSTCPTTQSNISIFWHIFAVFLLDVCFIYFFEPENPIYCALLAIIFWKLVWDDHNSTTIDLRYLALFFFLGLFIRNHGIVFSFYAGVTSFLILLVTMLHPYIHNKDTHYSLSRRPLFPIGARNIAIFKLSHQLPTQNKEISPFTLNSLIFNTIHIP